MTLDWRLAAHESAAGKVLAELARERAVERIWAKDTSLWSADPVAQKQIGDSLGWLDVLDWIEPQIPAINAFAGGIRAAGFENVVLLGMGGSSLAGEVLKRTFPPPAGWPRFHMLDSTLPAAIRALEAQLKLDKTLFIVASKSGGTLEVAAFHAYFYDRVNKLKGGNAGEQFIAITDPGTALAEKAAAQKFRKIFLNRADIGGRYSALSLFGLVPAALMGIDLEKFIAPAKAMAAACREPDPAKNPGARLGAAMGALALAGCDKLTLFFPPEWGSLGLWVEQLVAESTGKMGKGIVPVANEPGEKPSAYDVDRYGVFIRFPGLENDYFSVANLIFMNPSIDIGFSGHDQLGAAFYLWEFATAVAGAILEINPFDQPNVQESKEQTRILLEHYSANREFPADARSVDKQCMRVALGLPTAGRTEAFPQTEKAIFQDWLQKIGPKGQMALTAYLAPSPMIDKCISGIRGYVIEFTKTATTFGYGPRYLHSTGQLHKGGPQQIGVLQIVAPSAEEIPIPGLPYGFDVLQRAQALGDLLALARHNRPTLRVSLDNPMEETLQRLADAFPAILFRDNPK